MQVLKILNQIIAFVLELCMFLALGFMGFQLGKSVLMKYSLAIGLPLLAILLWAVFAAPKSNYRLLLPGRIFFEIILFSVTSFLLYKSGYKTVAGSFGIVVLLNESIAYFLNGNNN